MFSLLRAGSQRRESATHEDGVMNEFEDMTPTEVARSVERMASRRRAAQRRAAPLLAARLAYESKCSERKPSEEHGFEEMEQEEDR